MTGHNYHAVNRCLSFNAHSYVLARRDLLDQSEKSQALRLIAGAEKYLSPSGVLSFSYGKMVPAIAGRFKVIRSP